MLYAFAASGTDLQRLTYQPAAENMTGQSGDVTPTNPGVGEVK